MTTRGAQPLGQMRPGRRRGDGSYLGVLRRCKLSRRLVILALVAVLPVLALLHVALSSWNERLTFTEREIQGVEHIDPVADLLRSIPAYEDAINRVVAGDASARAAVRQGRQEIDAAIGALGDLRRGSASPGYPDVMYRHLVERWEAVTDSPPVQYPVDYDSDLLEAARQFAVGVADGMHLTQDPDLDSYYALEAAVVRLPAINSHLTALTRFGTKVIEQNDFSAMNRTRLISLTALLDNDLRALGTSVAVTIDVTGNAEVESTLRPALIEAVAATEAQLDLGEKLGRDSVVKPTAAAYRDAGEAALEKTHELWSRVTVAAEDLLHERLDGLTALRDRTLSLVALAFAGICLMVGWITRDIVKRKRAEERLAHDSTHDSLTGLFNRAHFSARVSQSLEQARRARERIGVLFLDCDDFKNVNDTLGHDAGDEVLRAMADRIKSSLRHGDVVARMGGDEFAILIPGLRDDGAAAAVAEKILEAFRRPVRVQEALVDVKTSVGIAVGPDDDDTVQDLLKKADVAMYQAKRSGKGRCVLFDEALHESDARTRRLREDLAHVVERNELVLHYQPTVDLTSGKIVGSEALVRWVRPDGIVPPLDFIPQAEESGLIVPIGLWVLREACRQTKQWQDVYPSDPLLDVSVNLSPRQLQEPSFVHDVVAVLMETGLPPSCLVLEITESVFLNDVESTRRAMSDLKSLGIRFAIDDFGTGYSSFGYLHRLPIEIVKIDRSFVKLLGDDSADALLPRGIIELSHKLGLTTVAEGVEEGRGVEALRESNCDLGQGYFFAAPMPADDLTARLQTGDHLDVPRTFAAPPQLRPAAN